MFQESCINHHRIPVLALAFVLIGKKYILCLLCSSRSEAQVNGFMDCCDPTITNTEESSSTVQLPLPADTPATSHKDANTHLKMDKATKINLSPFREAPFHVIECVIGNPAQIITLLDDQ